MFPARVRHPATPDAHLHQPPLPFCPRISPPHRPFPFACVKPLEGAGEEEREHHTLNERVSTRIRFLVGGMERVGQGQPPAPDVDAVQVVTPVILKESWVPSLQSMSIGWRGSAREVGRALISTWCTAGGGCATLVTDGGFARKTVTVEWERRNPPRRVWAVGRSGKRLRVGGYRGSEGR